MAHTEKESTEERLCCRHAVAVLPRGLWKWKGLFPWKPGACASGDWVCGFCGNFCGAPAPNTQPGEGGHADGARSVVGLLPLVAIRPRPCKGSLNGSSRAAGRPWTAAQGRLSLPTVASLAFLASSGAWVWEPVETRAPLYSASSGPVVPVARSGGDRAPGGTRGPAREATSPSAPPPVQLVLLGHSGTPAAPLQGQPPRRPKRHPESTSWAPCAPAALPPGAQVPGSPGGTESTRQDQGSPGLPGARPAGARPASVCRKLVTKPVSGEWREPPLGRWVSPREFSKPRNCTLHAFTFGPPTAWRDCAAVSVSTGAIRTRFRAHLCATSFPRRTFLP